MVTAIELLFVALVAAVVTLAAIRAIDWLIETMPLRLLPWSVLALVALALIAFSAAAVVRVGRLP